LLKEKIRTIIIAIEIKIIIRTIIKLRTLTKLIIRGYRSVKQSNNTINRIAKNK
jgi:hypothetical protein